MHPIQRILGLLLMLFSLTMLVPVAIAWVEHDSGLQPFLMAFGTLLGAGFILWLPARGIRRDLRLRDGFMVVVLFWFVLGLAGAVPLYLAVKPSLGVADAVFESLSGLTTTGATVITNLFSAIPLVGDWIVTLLWGGFAVDNATLNRFFSLHYLLPFVL